MRQRQTRFAEQGPIGAGYANVGGAAGPALRSRSPTVERQIDTENDLTPEVREQMERIVIKLLELASRCDDNPAVQQTLMQLADQISRLLAEH
jgi:ubiquinone biosynthesis protein UbiJ